VYLRVCFLVKGLKCNICKNPIFNFGKKEPN
jgi:hypothetical protein